MSAVAVAVGVVGAAGAMAGGAMAASGAKSAAAIQAASADKATQAQMDMYKQTRSDLAPYMTYGGNAFSQLAQIFGFGGAAPGTATGATAGTPGATDAAGGTGQPNPALATQLLTQMPGYQFGLDQGMQALDRSAASKGRLLSGAQLIDAQKFGQGYAMQNAWQPYVSELNWATGMGENAAAGAGNAAMATGQGVANTTMASGNASAAGVAGSANAWGGAFSQLGEIAKGAATSYQNNRNNSPSFDFGSAGAPDMTSAFDFSNTLGAPADTNWSFK